MKLKSNIDLGKAFEFFKSQIKDIDAELREKKYGDNSHIYAYGRLSTMCEWHLKECTEPANEDDLSGVNIFSSPGKNSEVEQEVINELDNYTVCGEVAKQFENGGKPKIIEEDNMHPVFKNVFENLGAMFNPKAGNENTEGRV